MKLLCHYQKIGGSDSIITQKTPFFASRTNEPLDGNEFATKILKFPFSCNNNKNNNGKQKGTSGGSCIANEVQQQKSELDVHLVRPSTVVS
jgi:hypothetical protein